MDLDNDDVSENEKENEQLRILVKLIFKFRKKVTPIY